MRKHCISGILILGLMLSLSAEARHLRVTRTIRRVHWHRRSPFAASWPELTASTGISMSSKAEAKGSVNDFQHSQNAFRGQSPAFQGSGRNFKVTEKVFKRPKEVFIPARRTFSATRGDFSSSCGDFSSSRGDFRSAQEEFISDEGRRRRILR